MAEFTPLATMIKAPQPFETIGPALNAANAAQNLQRGNIELQQADIKLRERKGIEELFRNRVGEFTDAQGNIDFNKLIPLGLSAAPTTFRDYVPQLAEGVQKASQAQESISKLTQDQLHAISQTSCGVLRDMGPQIQWVQSYVTDDKIYCVYIAPDEASVREHAKRGGFPANSVARVATTIDPTTSE